MFDRAFWLAAVELAAKAAASCLLGLWAGDRVSVVAIDWPAALSVAAGAALVSLLTSVVSSPFGAPGSPLLAGRHARKEIAP